MKYHDALRTVLGEFAAETLVDGRRLTLSLSDVAGDGKRKVVLFLFESSEQRSNDVAEIVRRYHPLDLRKLEFGFELVYAKTKRPVGNFSQLSLRELQSSMEFTEEYGFVYQQQSGNTSYVRYLLWALTALALYAAFKSMGKQSVEEEAS